MQFLTESESRKWCASNSFRLSAGKPAVESGKEFEIPADAGKRVLLVNSQLGKLSNSTKHLVWITGWGIWAFGERMHIFSRLRASYGETRPLIEVPGAIFASSEKEDLISYVTLGVLFLWDIYVIASKSKRWVFYSHDEYGIHSGFA